MNLPDVYAPSNRRLMRIRFLATFIGGIFSMLLLATGLVDVSNTYFPAAIAQYVNPRSALVITMWAWYILWDLYLGPKGGGESTVALKDRIAPSLLLFLFFLVTTGLYRQLLDSGGGMPLDYAGLEGMERFYPWVMFFCLCWFAYFGAREDYEKQTQERENQKDY